MVDAAGAVIEGSAVVAAEISGDAEEGKKAIGGGEFEAVEVAGVGDVERRDRQEWTNLRGAEEGFGGSNRGAEVGVATEDDDVVLGGKGRRKDAREQNESREKFEHRRPFGLPSRRRDARGKRDVALNGRETAQPMRDSSLRRLRSE